MRKPIRAIIFDLDNTIIDSEQLWVDAALAIVASKGIPLTSEQKERASAILFGIGEEHARNLFHAHLAPIYPESFEQLFAEIKDEVAKRYHSDLQLVPGIERIITHLIEKNIARAIATNSTIEHLEIAKKRFNLPGMFGEHIYHAGHVGGKEKPDPALYLYAAAQLGVSPDECMAIEDSVHGLKSAKAAGMRTIAINRFNDARLHELADIVISTYSEIDLKELAFLSL